MRMKNILVLACLLTPIFAIPARADVVQHAADGFHVHVQVDVAHAPKRVYADLLRIDRWWSSSHTFSGKAQNLSLQARAGGCFCEHWNGGSVEHARVIAALPGHALVLEGALGPLQTMAVEGVLRFALTPHDGGTRVEVDYRVNGSSLSQLSDVAPAVDRVITEQVTRLARFSDRPRAATAH
ncbi:SRPBCC family protein [Oleiagrimonas citrea]|jgi:uncharacterized protein YndB with AHSA1/START domain